MRCSIQIIYLISFKQSYKNLFIFIISTTVILFSLLFQNSFILLEGKLRIDDAKNNSLSITSLKVIYSSHSIHFDSLPSYLLSFLSRVITLW